MQNSPDIQNGHRGCSTSTRRLSIPILKVLNSILDESRDDLYLVHTHSPVTLRRNRLPAFDMRTVLVIFVLVNYICAFLMVLTVRVSQKRFDGVKYFLANFIFQSAGMTLALLRPHISPLFSVVLANALMFSGVIAFSLGAGKFTHRHISRAPHLIYTAVFLSAYCYFTYVMPDIRIRTMLFSGMLIPVFAFIAHTLLAPSDKKFAPHCIFPGISFILFTALYIFRFYYAFSGNDISNYFSTHSPDAVINILTMLLSILLMYSIQHMISSRLFAEFEQLAADQSKLLVQMEEMATKDHLTGLYNRRKIEEIIKYEIGQYNRYEIPLCLILCDIDHFKDINDSYGHDVGDTVITHTTRLLCDNKRDTDNAGRWGGEEFIIVTPHTSLEQTMVLAERFRRTIESSQPATAAGHTVTLSFGIAQYSRGMSVEAFIKQADKALYRAKQHGRNRVEATCAPPVCTDPLPA
ncbi:GGDEF domain-containing protein [Desulfovibrio mangrovi]|uniref:GGDEF domain-containing protein n=1 Tax=Desulfovibrio mangrovi TaxID=2976983 RepID=UPI002245446A|nr:GGDEF domain-containing protein [Desulfovibrio mangrovi]UZP66043.1 GGDEF domain-containing protein [Desulfovibrio mangrovi]